MTDKKSNEPSSGKGKDVFSHFQPDGKFALIQDRYEYEKGMESLPVEEQELVKELTNFADLCKYFEGHGREFDSSFATAVNKAATLPLPERVAPIREINRKLMESIGDAGEGTPVRN